MNNSFWSDMDMNARERFFYSTLDSNSMVLNQIGWTDLPGLEQDSEISDFLI